MRFTFLVGVMFVLLFFIVFAQKAYAYLDPGTGSYILQFGLAIIMGGLFAIKIFWGTIFRFFKRVFSKNHERF